MALPPSHSSSPSTEWRELTKVLTAQNGAEIKTGQTWRCSGPVVMGKHLIPWGKADAKDRCKAGHVHCMKILQVLFWSHHYASSFFFLHVTLKIRLKVTALVNSRGRIWTQACLPPEAPALCKYFRASQMSSIPYHILDFSRPLYYLHCFLLNILIFKWHISIQNHFKRKLYITT